jgi:uncharacterized linocin/CFP29 family protein
MSEKYLQRDSAPFSNDVWYKIDEAVVASAKSQLCGRKLLNIKGPYGLGLKAIPGGDKPLEEKTSGSAKLTAPCVIPLAMIMSEFGLPVRDIAAFEQTGLPLDPGNAVKAAMDCARQEDNLVFNGSKNARLKGLMNIDGSASVKLSQWDEVGAAADDIIKAVTTLDKAGFHGPYTLGLSAELYNLLFRRYLQGNQTEMEHIRQFITDGIIKAPAIPSGGVLLNSGSQFAAIVLGQDLMTAFVGPSGNDFLFTVYESAALNVNEPAALCILKK